MMPLEEFHDEEGDRFVPVDVDDFGMRASKKTTKRVTFDDTAECRPKLRKSHTTFLVVVTVLLLAVIFGLGVLVGYVWNGEKEAVANNEAAIDSRPVTTEESITANPQDQAEEPPEEPTTPAIETAAPTLSRYEIKAQQIENFKNDKGILLNLNVVHHGGTTVCQEVTDVLKGPSFNCLNPLEQDDVGDDFPADWPWASEDTAINIEIVKKNFKFLTWTLHPHKPVSVSRMNEKQRRKQGNSLYSHFLTHNPMFYCQPTLSDTDWENPNLVSMLVIREPLSRSLAGDALMQQMYPGIFVHDNATITEWWDFARNPTHTNNFALRVLSANHSCCSGETTDRSFLEQAKEQIRRFTFVLDIDCLEHGLEKIAEQLEFELHHWDQSEDKNHDHSPVKDRIPFPDVYEFLQKRNKLDIELYEWAKERALVDCKAVYADEAEKDKEKQNPTLTGHTGEKAGTAGDP